MNHLRNKQAGRPSALIFNHIDTKKIMKPIDACNKPITAILVVPKK